MKIKEYQNEAIKQLFERSKRLLNQTGNKKIIFKSPTGSGKTIMMAEFLAKLADDKKPRPLSFIWAAPRRLHAQSREKLERHYENSRALECAYFHELTNKRIDENEILFLNWESIRSRDRNTIVKENETEFYLSKILENTKSAGCDVILIIDESHYHATSSISQQLIGDINPKLTVEVSATPVLQNPDDMVAVALEHVKAEGMIKKSVILNEGFANTLTADGITPAFAENADEFVLQQALTKRRQLADVFNATGVKVNPLLCIQLPDRRMEQDENVKNTAMQVLSDNDITVQNGKLAIWLSEEKENLEGISQNDNETEVIIFKQAIALGWDCPRAHILVLFRNWRSEVFSVQTLGRIMRMPEPEFGHYENKILNSGYVYTNLPKVSINEDVAGGYVHIYTAHRIDNYVPLKLPSVHRLRQREQTRLSPLFITLFLQAAKEYKLLQKIKRDNQNVQAGFIADYDAAGIDAITGKTIEGDVSLNVKDEEDLQKLFDYFARDNLSPFYPEDRSIGRVKSAIYEFFSESLEMEYEECSDKIVNIVLSETNRLHFVNVLNTAKEKYRKEIVSKKEPLQKTPKWEVPITVTFSETYCSRNTEKSAMNPFYAAANESLPEKEFIKLLENSPKIKWWYKNGESESVYFAVPYSENGEQHPFYVDFIVRFNDDTIGLYDTKSGRTIDDAKNKSDGLLDYIKKANRAGKKLAGGIVTPANPSHYEQGWKIYQGKGKVLISRDLSNWQPLEI